MFVDRVYIMAYIFSLLLLMEKLVFITMIYNNSSNNSVENIYYFPKYRVETRKKLVREKLVCDKIFEEYDFRYFDQYKKYILKLHPEFKEEYRSRSELDRVLRNMWRDQKEDIGKIVFIDIRCNYTLVDKLPYDLVFNLSLDLDNVLYRDVFWKQGIGLYIHRPDGIIVSLIPYYSYPKNKYDKWQYANLRDRKILLILGIGFRIEPNSIVLVDKWDFSFRRYFDRLAPDPLAYNKPFEPIFKKANETIRIGEWINPSIIFSEATYNSIHGNYTPLPGLYMLEIIFLLTLKPSDVDLRINVDPIDSYVLVEEKPQKGFYLLLYVLFIIVPIVTTTILLILFRRKHG